MIDQVTAVIPFLRGGNEDWLRRAIGSLPKGLRYLIAENDGELADALNTALDAVETEFVFRLDADDWLSNDTLDFLVGLAWDADVTYPTLILAFEHELPYESLKAAPFCPHRLLVENYIPGTALFRPERALAVGGYRDLPLLEDWDLWVRMSQAGSRFKAVPEALYWYRQVPTSRNKATAEVKAAVKRQIVPQEPNLEATFYYQGSYPQAYLRCLLPARHLPGQAGDHLPFEVRGDDVAFTNHRGHAAVWQFPGDTVRAIQMSEMQEQGIRVLVEVDDNYLSPECARMQPAWGKKHGDGYDTLEAHRKIAGWADGIIVTTDELGKRYRPVNRNIFVCPNQVEPDDWADATKPDDGIFRVGWFASSTHGKDAALVRRALEWASRQKDVEVVTMGLDPSWTFKRRHVPWSNDMGVYRQLLRNLDVGLAPVVPDAWSTCRSDVKALDYVMAGAAPVVSDEPPYKTWTPPGALKARTAAQFFGLVKHLVRNRDEARQLADEQRAWTLEHRTYAGNAWRWEEACQRSTTRSSTPARAATTPSSPPYPERKSA